MTHLFVLGASDPEMSAIETLLTQCGVPFVYAMICGRRVSAGEAYSYARTYIDYDTKAAVVREGGTFHFVECDIEIDPEDVDKVAVCRYDHHRPGDPGFGHGPEEFLSASSIGQVISGLAKLGLLHLSPQFLAASYCGDNDLELTCGAFGAVTRYTQCPAPNTPYMAWWVGAGAVGGRSLGWQIPQELVLIAAADHCLAHAYAGRCPGVASDALMHHRTVQRARFTERSFYDIMADIEAARVALLAAPELVLSSHQCRNVVVRDMRGMYTVTTTLVAPFCEGATVDSAGVGDAVYVVAGPRDEGCWDEGGHVTVVSRGVHELPEAGTRYGIAYIADGLPLPDGRIKTVCSGPAEVIEAFLRWAPSNGLVDCYGDPARGFAGGYHAST